MHVCIGGMHRSGTSMVANVANLLCQCGLYLGNENELVPPSPDNLLGYWENIRFVEINTEILEILGGKWYAPPIAPDGWTTKKELAHVKRKAELLVQEFSGQEHWGWKDPRSSLTLPFWTSLVLDLKVIICLRNPLEVALSLRRRPVFKYSAGNILWRRLKEVRAALSLTRRRFFSLTACTQTLANLQRANTGSHDSRKQDHLALRKVPLRSSIGVTQSSAVSWRACAAGGG